MLLCICIEVSTIDRDYLYYGVYTDTNNIFSFIIADETIAVSHDFKTREGYKLPVISAVLVHF